MMSVMLQLRTADAQLQVHLSSATLDGFAWVQLIALAHVLTTVFNTASSGSFANRCCLSLPLVCLSFVG